jgi:hypothetical protein
MYADLAAFCCCISDYFSNHLLFSLKDCSSSTSHRRRRHHHRLMSLRFHYIIAKKGWYCSYASMRKSFFAEYAAGFFAPAHTFAIKAPFRSDDFLFAMLNFLTRKNAEMRDVYKNIENENCRCWSWMIGKNMADDMKKSFIFVFMLLFVSKTILYSQTIQSITTISARLKTETSKNEKTSIESDMHA